MAFCLAGVFSNLRTAVQAQEAPPVFTKKFSPTASGLELERHTQLGSFFSITGRRSAVLGYENRPLEAWIYPLKILDDFRLSFQLEGYPLEIQATDIAVSINVRPEATTFTYSHSAFTARHIIFTPIDEAGIVMLLDVQSVLPVDVTWSFKPRLRLMWPAGSMTSNLSWVEKERVYNITEETNRFVGIVGSPTARDISVMPYQEEPRDAPVKFIVKATPEAMSSNFIPIIITASTEGRAKAKATYDRLLNSIQPLYEKNVAHYKQFLSDTVSIETPEKKLNDALNWAKIGVEKGTATNPLLGTGLIAGFRTSGESERPGFAWFFGRDAIWTTFAINSYGDFATTRTALDFLKKFQREDGKIPHEISQSASLIDWFTKYTYAWASADATPLYVIAHADYWRSTGDAEFIKNNWDSILKAYRFAAGTDTDNNNLIENTKFGHGWVEGGALHPPHEEVYMQGVWIEALRGLAELADLMGDAATASVARAGAERTRASMEQIYWQPERGFYAFSTFRPRTTPPEAEPGPNRPRRQARMEALSNASLIDEDTVLPAVPLWWRTMEDARAQSQIDHLGSGELATDWGSRLLSDRSQLYDPLSYHYGSVWPLFTGWSSMGAYRYGRAHVGYQALMANVALTYQGALGYITELLSGDYNVAFGRSSHHQIWSEAMVVTPAIRGLLGLEASAGGRTVTFAPHLPINWDSVSVRNFSAGKSHYDISLNRAAGQMTIKTMRRTTADVNTAGDSTAQQLNIAPAFPLDARIRSVSVNGKSAQFKITREGDIQRAEVLIVDAPPDVTLVINYEEGTDVYMEHAGPQLGASNQGLRVLRSRADANALRLTTEGLGGRTYPLSVRTPHQLSETANVKITSERERDAQLLVSFDGPADVYVRRELLIPLQPRGTTRRGRRN
ncbi:MAG: GH116 family glycosyl hydrolase [Pyrinomonadaceae bacterium]